MIVTTKIIIKIVFQNDEKKSQYKGVLPFSHISTVAPISILIDELNLPANKIPGEFYPFLR